MRLAVLLAIANFYASKPAFSQVPNSAKQLILAVGQDWNSATAVLQCWERPSANEPWKPAFKSAWPVNLGRSGMAWGRGAFNPPNSTVPWKVEKDGKAPAGVFELGRLHGYADAPPRGATWPYMQVGPWDAWVDDPRLPHYNEHVRVDPSNVPPWFESQKMRLGDAAYKWLLEIRHNTNPAAPGYGSAIFFHVRRGPTKPSAGCTTMAVENLEAMIRWLKTDKYPYYVLLPQGEYQRMKATWKLP
ncbi:MAG TPA: L,D-transpeptidase family protein [Verrucomicrobium sp.]|nr:L,D-transpeptidase family protein [Verrucomicrobium sp.]